MSVAATFVQSLTLQGGRNTLLVIVGTALLGLAGGVAGSFALLRKRSLFADALGHATLPGVCVAFLIAEGLGSSGRSLPVLLAGATVAAVLATVLVQAMLRYTRLHEDAIIGVVLSVLFGVGVVLLSVIQTLPSGDQGGLKTFLFGQTAAMQQHDAILLGAIALATTVVAAAFFKELALVAFDELFARAIGLRTGAFDLLLLLLVVAVTVAGLQAVGLMLVIAILIIPPVAARLWTNRTKRFVPLAALIGAVSGWIGASISSLAPRQPAGAVIVLTAASFFLISLFVAPRGVLASQWRRARLSTRIAADHVMKLLLKRAMPTRELARSLGHRAGTTAALAQVLKLRGYVHRTADGWTLTERGHAAGATIARNHRLWALYLVRDAHLAPDHVDPSAEAIEHILDPVLLQDLERTLAAEPSPAATTGRG
ncbi:MAG: iron chelate uptake ABC transporter family permease subunit [Phycisphaerae bacterium]|nr:iron chelate uptake ABC transporter family permease subunit [Phycisphaerae bacterium]